MNGMVRYLGGKQSQIKINIQHSKSANDRVKAARKIIMKREEDIEVIKEDSQITREVTSKLSREKPTLLWAQR